MHRKKSKSLVTQSRGINQKYPPLSFKKSVKSQLIDFLKDYQILRLQITMSISNKLIKESCKNWLTVSQRLKVIIKVSQLRTKRTSIIEKVLFHQSARRANRKTQPFLSLTQLNKSSCKTKLCPNLKFCLIFVPKKSKNQNTWKLHFHKSKINRHL